MISSIVSRIVILVFGTLYPAYASYKGIRTKNVKEYVKWMMYWIVFALFTCAETFTDVFFSFWFPFYYEIKIILVLWLLSPATNGSSILYRRFVHPALSRREAEIDEALARATEQGYTAVLHLGSRGVNYATTVLMQTAIKNLPNVSPNATKSILPASQSESALSSLASPTETPPKESKNDSPDGVRTRRRRIKSDNNPVIKIERMSSATDPSTDEDFELEIENESENDDQALIQDPDFKVPKKRGRKPKKERARSTSRKRKTRSTKDDKSDAEFSDVVDFDFEPRRRERVGRRGYSPRRTQSSHNRVDMYFSEVDVEVRQPRSDEPIVSLNNIRSSEDISSGYSSGEALHNHRGSAHSEALVRTASVGGRTRLKPRSTTKKAPEVEEEDSDHNSLPYRDQLPLPDPPTFLSADQALKLLSFLSQHLACNDFLNINTNFSKTQDSSDAQSTRNLKFFIPDEGENKKKLEDETSVSNRNVAYSIPKIVTPENENESHQKSSTEIDMGKLTDDICKEKFDELKKLLKDAHKAVSNIVSSQEGLSKYDSDEENIDVDDDAGHGKNLVQTYGSISALEVWSTPNISRSNSDNELRAGKYHKKPAPRAPTSNSVEDLEDAESEKALKATLVIKTGTLKSFTDSGDTQKLRSRKPNKAKTKDGFSKLLTIPKNIFHSALHKDQKDKARHDDSSPATSDCSDNRSRSSSISSENTLTDNTLSTSKELNTEKYMPKIEKAKTEEKSDYVDFPNEKTVIRTDEKNCTEATQSSGSAEMFRERFRIRQMSHSPTRGTRKTFE
ncbi:uncharacterized protein LOC117182922 [Belonocnema kinseyi]|uniref:uncharacterized protein LOC117182922 n=1 Tax=Belonocnema kinseyi TaxID=2817044 RepID=UPI00143CEFBD|nr:uncharacterized protein LOC117182922 [Belonocnema kinseyi]